MIMNMKYIEIKPTLSNCIESLTKKEYEQTLNLLLKNEDIYEELGERLEVLRIFLESVDFAELRSQYEKYLMEGKKVTFFIYSQEGKVGYRMKVE